MTDVFAGSTVTLGSVSESGRCDVFSASTHEVETVSENPAGGGVYACARREFNFLFGARGGQIQIALDAHSPDEVRGNLRCLRDNGPETLDSILTEDGGVAVCDTTGVCYWPSPRNAQSRFDALDVQGKTICALAAHGEFLRGLSASGQLFKWHLPEGTLVEVTDVPSPPSKLALVRMLHLPAPDALAFPSSAGEIVMVSCAAERTDSWAAHQQEFYVLLECEEGLLSCGRHDQQAKLWAADCSTPLATLGAPKGITAGAFVPALQRTLILLKDSGHAAVYALEEERLRRVYELPKGDYRSVAGPAPRELREAEEELKKDEIRRIVRELGQAHGRLSDAERESRHRCLEELDAEHVSLEIKAKEAQSVHPEQITEELSLRVKQADILEDAPAAVGPLMRLVWLLELVHLQAMACEVYQRIQGIQPQESLCKKIAQLDADIAAIESGEAIIELDKDAPMQTVIEASSIVDRRVTGRFLVAQLAPLWCGDTVPNTRDILGKYETTRGEWEREQGIRIPSASLKKTSWLTDGSQTLTETLFVELECGNPRVLLALSLSAGVRRTQPVLVLDVREEKCETPGTTGRAPTDWAKHNELVLDAFTQLREAGSADVWCKNIHQALRETFGRLANENDSRYDHEEGERQ
jgi:hypothetical protein